MPTLFQIKSYLTFWLDAVDEHSLHSPFLFDLYTKVIKPASGPAQFEAIEAFREKLLQNRSIITVADPGAGSLALKGAQRRISDIATTSLSPARYSALYARVIRHFACRHLVELGTSLGINTLYLGHAPETTVSTFEGAPEVADLARTTFEFAGATNIKLIEGNIDTSLPSYLLNAPKVDFAFVDAHHRYDPTLKYVQWLIKKVHARSVIILDDIHYSPDMERAWNELKRHELVYASADLYRCGFLFFDPSLNKQHVVLQY
jgi:predicted O-methyltransferase YrrM